MLLYACGELLNAPVDRGQDRTSPQQQCDVLFVWDGAWVIIGLRGVCVLRVKEDRIHDYVCLICVLKFDEESNDVS